MTTSLTDIDLTVKNDFGRSSPFALEMSAIAKSYGTVAVIHGVDFRVRRGSIHALLGANGAGKSTLLKIAVGATEASAGHIRVDGQPQNFASPLDARQAGIGMVFQERSLVPELSTVDNLFLNSELRRLGIVDRRKELREAHQIFDHLGVDIPLSAKVGTLGIADQQMVEIAKAVRLASTVLILDEPSAALTEREVQRLFGVVRQIASRGVGIVYVSHRLTEIFDLCDEVTIMRDGRVILSDEVSKTTMKEVVEAIAGGAVHEQRIDDAQAQRPNFSASEQAPVLEVRGLRVGSKLKDVSFTVSSDEVLGIAGLAGSGRTTLLKALFGLILPAEGEVRIGGRSVRPQSPAQAIRNGLYLIPENRKTQGLVLSHSVAANLLMSVLKRLSNGILMDRRRSRQATTESIAKFRINPPDLSKVVEWLSGGNQQKVVLGKAFNARGRVLLLDEPTFGVDIHSRADIQDRIREFTGAGNAAIWVTSDLRELCEVADRILILADGTVRDVIINRPQRSEAEITHLIQAKAD
ncbi:sugar ABC transporter ATP-binding protein [Aminobacter sp. MDW-2]|uniref:sugar ABC transporter ATP-binding protein n=1 Tax=Aminobacter sp. MDW-2 TaxID=2666139 RepID=UPI0012B1488C|nr:sugar ABC transporter ATP-binding protein [Aminobacter sp. MDW-2]MRX37579.1 ATP-binding cassette domain-containing protein [Aminobacter sp. MDW-2]QNH37889.1 sugar ABC transporter ATP-binding protein [Aminobacter sp. MDW-2]